MERWSLASMLAVAWHLSCALPAASAQEAETTTAARLEIGETMIVDLEPCEATDEGECWRRRLEHLCPEDQQLFWWARSDSIDFRIHLEKLGAPSSWTQESQAGGEPVVATFSTLEGERCTFTLLSSAPGEIELHLETAPLDPERLRAAEEAKESLEEVRRLRRAGEREAAQALRRPAVDRLVEACDGVYSVEGLDLLWKLAAESEYHLDPRRAIEEWERVLAGFRKVRPSCHNDLASLHFELSRVHSILEDLTAEEAHLSWARSILKERRPGNTELLRHVELNLAVALSKHGRYVEAREQLVRLQGEHLAALGPNHEIILFARMAFANILLEMGDHAGARAEYEELLALFLEQYSPDHPYVIRARANLANVTSQQAGVAEALAEQREALAVMERRLGPAHPDVATARANVARSLSAIGRHAEAIESLERAIEAGLRTLPENHPRVQAARAGLADAVARSGDPERAIEIHRLLLEQREEMYPPGHPHLQRSLEIVAGYYQQHDRLDELLPLAERLAAGLRRRARVDLTLSKRGRVDAARRGGEGIDQLITLAATLETTKLNAAIVELIELNKILADTSPRVLDAAAETDEELGALRDRVRETHRRVSELAARVAAHGMTSEERDTLRAAILARDLAEREYSAELVKRGFWYFAEVSVAEIAGSLPEDGAAVCYWRTSAGRRTPREPHELGGSGFLEATVILPVGTIHTVSLGPSPLIVPAAERWRRALGAPFEGSSAPADTAQEKEAGKALREWVLDPVLAVAGDPETLYVTPADFLHFIPLDALPLGKDRVGDQHRVVTLNYLSELPLHRAASSTEPSLLALGAIDYDGPAINSEEARPAGEASGSRNHLLDGRFESLDETAEEVTSLVALFERKHGDRATELTGSAATKAAFLAAARDASLLHLATHGAFLDRAARSWSSADGVEVVEALAPHALCGMAFAGANHRPAGAQDYPGILTAEELAGLDLSRCELAVLSTCEGGLGLRSTGQVLWSLQTALRCAGVRQTLTSLWKTDDSPTRRLMNAFYAELLGDETVTPSEALWRAKRVLRRGRVPVRDWAGWVLCGSPD